MMVRTCLARFVMVAVVGVVGGGLASETRASVVTIANPSFESPAFGIGGFNPATGWTLVGGTGATGGAYRPGLAVNFVPDGVQVGYASSFGGAASALYQNLGVPVIEGALYQLDLYVGRRREVDANYLVELLVGTTTIGSVSGVLNSTFAGNFIPISLTAVGVGSGTLGIRLGERTVAGQSLFDDARLSYTTVSAVPEPASGILMGVGLAVVLGMGWGRSGVGVGGLRRLGAEAASGGL